MLEIIKFSQHINEMLLHPDFKLGDAEVYNIIAYDKYIYFIEKNDSDALAQIGEIINSNRKVLFKIDTGDEFSADYDTILDEIISYYPNILIFEYKTDNDDTVIFNSKNEFRQDFKSSKYVIDVLKKLLYELKIKFITTVDEIGDDYGSIDEQTYFAKDLIEDWEKDIRYTKLPEHIYHGTSIKYLRSILKSGIQPAVEKSNYIGIKHSSRIFFAADKNNAIFHAVASSDTTNQPAIILEIESKGLDITKIDFDYDLYISYISSKDEHDYSKMTKLAKDYNPKTLAHLKNKYIGATYRKFAYKGVLFPKHIVKIYYNSTDSQSDFKWEVKKEDFNKFLEKYEYLREVDTEFSNINYDLSDYLYDEMKREEEVQEEVPEEVQESKKIIPFNAYVRAK